MDTAQIKAYAPQARNDFISAVTERAARFGIHGDDNFDPVEFKGDTAIIGSQVFTKKGGELREKLVAKVRQQGFKMFIRSSAYTWFNRFVAIRYMELHDFLDHGLRVLSNPNGSDIPEVLEHATEVDLPELDKEKVLELRLAGDKDNELYRMLVIAQCNALNKAMPFLFDEIDNEAELLLPDNLLHTNSPVKKMVSEIDENLWDDVEIIGWIYQFYISEKKDEVIGKVVKSEDIPAATQLFTPNWIVKYMVQNTLGRMWMATYPGSSLKSKMEFYIEPAEQEPEVQAEIDATTPKELNPEELTFLDPACGSGHILVEAYDILKEIYLERGYRTRDIPRLILSKNIYGLDIDDRAAQLACFAVLMRARKDDRRLFSRDDLILNIMSIVETKGIDKDKLLGAVSKRDGGKGVWHWINELVGLFENAKTFGSLIQIPDELVDQLDTITSTIEQDQIGSDDIFNYIAGTEMLRLKPIIKQAQLLAKKYYSVVTNPPYMGARGMNSKLKAFVKNQFPASKSDAFAIFIERNFEFSMEYGLVGMITMQSWMFLSSYKNLREKIVSQKTILTMAHLGARAFDSISGEVVSTSAFILKNNIILNLQANYYRLIDPNSEKGKKVSLIKAIQNPGSKYFFKTSASNFVKIPGTPIVYWIKEKALFAFENDSVEDHFIAKKGMAIGDNAKFLRRWPEVSKNNIKYNVKNHIETHDHQRWYPCLHGGTFRRWGSNKEYVVNWKNDGSEPKTAISERTGDHWSRYIISTDLFFSPGINWTAISSSSYSARFHSNGFAFTSASMAAFGRDEDPKLLLALVNSVVGRYFLSLLSPTLNYGIAELKKIPYIPCDTDKRLKQIIDTLIAISKIDWDAYEVSWDFKSVPLLHSDFKQSFLEDTYNNLNTYRQEIIFETKRLEEENNGILIDVYGLQDELIPDIPIHEITLTCNPHYRYGKGKTDEEYQAFLLTDTIKELISYTVGCAVGRYSLDHSGLIFANRNNHNFDSSRYKSFPADDDGIIPIMDMDWFEDDATKRFVDFIKIAWPKEHLDENLKFIADNLKPKSSESSVDTIRRYLSTSFFKDHMKMYKKRPIYWMFSSGKQKAFECLVYLHRYNESTLSRMRSNYVTPLQGNIIARIEFLEHEKDASTTASAQKKIQKQIDVLKKKQVELKAFDDELRHYADMRISLDLDDGVKVNYGKFGNLLAEKKAIAGKK